MIESPGLVGLEQRRTKAASRSATKSLLRAHAERIALAHWTGPYDPIPQEALQVELAETSRYIGVKHANLSEATVKAWCALDGDAIRAEQLTEGHNMPNESKTVVRTTPVTAGPSRHVRTNLEKRQAQQPAPEPPKGNGAPPPEQKSPAAPTPIEAPALPQPPAAAKKKWDDPQGKNLIVAGDRPGVLYRAQETLSTVGNVYQRGGRLVEVVAAAEVQKSKRDLIERDPESLTQRALSAERAVTLLTEKKWYKYLADGTLRHVDFPRDHALGVLAEADWPDVRPLTGIIGAPTLRADGTILAERGYDQSTGLVLAANIDFPAVPSEPTKDEARLALDRLSEPFLDFPFVSEVSRAAFLVTVLAAVSRNAYPTAPATGFGAPEAGTGKTKLADAVGIIAHGTTPAHFPLSAKSEELRKVLLSFLLGGDPILLLDNIDRELASAELANFITSDRYSDRILGLSRTAKLPVRCLVLATGNNLTIAGDLTRRFLTVEIDAKQEQPEARGGFRIPDLNAYLRAHRGQLAVDALTILRAFYVADPEQQAAPLGSFEGWSRVVREPLLWLGLPDPCETIARAREQDPDRQRFAHLLTTLHGHFQGSPKTTAEIISMARDTTVGSPNYPDIRAALIDALGSERDLETGALGRYFRKRNRRIVGEFTLERQDSGRAWRILETTQ